MKTKYKLLIVLVILRCLAGIWLGAYIDSLLPDALRHDGTGLKGLYWWSWPYFVTQVTFLSANCGFALLAGINIAEKSDKENRKHDYP